MLAKAPVMPIVAITCSQVPNAHVDAVRALGAHIHPVTCVGNLHSSVVELFIRNGSPGVIVFGCPPRDCVGREGPKWLQERTFNDREAELQPRVDRRRVRIGTMAGGDLAGTLATYNAFVRDLTQLDAPVRDSNVDIDLECEPVPYEDPSS